MIVLDTLALLAYLCRESGHDVVEEYIESSLHLHRVLSEVAGRFTRDGIDATLLIQQIQQTSIAIIPFTKTHPCMPPALFLISSATDYRWAIELAWAVLTADNVWAELVGIEVDIVQIRKGKTAPRR